MPPVSTQDLLRQLEERLTLVELASLRFPIDPTARSVLRDEVQKLLNNKDVSLRELSHDLVFSSSDTDTVAWASGSIRLSNNRLFTIDAGNTGNMSAKTFIYLDTEVSGTVLQTTTTFSTAVGENKRIIAIAQNNAAGATFQVHSGIGGINLVAGDLNVSTLSAIAADLGTITAGTVTGATLRTAASGTRFQMTSIAFQGINSAGTTIFEVIIDGANAGDVIMGDDATGNYAQWDDSAGTFTINGAEGVGANIQEFTGNGTWTKPTGAKTVLVQAWGGGGAGGGVNGNNGSKGGGGGSSYDEFVYDAADLGATEAVVVGAGGTATSGDGGAGGNSTFDTLTAFGGGGGGGAGVGNDAGGGGAGVKGAGSAAAGVSTGGDGGDPLGGDGGDDAGNTPGGTSTFGGGGGGASGASGEQVGGESVMGGGGGGGGNGGGTAGVGGASWKGGGVGGGGLAVAGGAGGVSTYGGNGGAGGTESAGGAGTAPGGGGGGAHTASSATFSGGAGGAGKVIVTTTS